MEVIATKSERTNRANIFLMVTGVICVVVALILLIWLISNGGFTSENLPTSFIFGYCVFAIFAVGAGLILVGFLSRRHYQKLPYELIVYDDGQFIFAGGYRCSPADVTNIQYRQATSHSDYMGTVFHDYGRITVYTKGKTISYNNVANVERAHGRLIYYMQNSFEKPNNSDRIRFILRQLHQKSLMRKASAIFTYFWK